jgi:outer membrane protein, heavy metal efflux system
MHSQTHSKIMWAFILIFAAIFFLFYGHAFAQQLKLSDLLDEALKNNPDLFASQAKIEAAGYRVPQSKSLPDPMLMVGYQNEGLTRYTYGMEPDAQWMFSASQMFPYPGKRALKGSMAESDLDSLKSMHEFLKRKIEARVKDLYYDLFLAYKEIDLLGDKAGLFARLEDLALARYSTGKAMQEEVLMAQTEKYMLLEKKEMFKQKIRSDEAMMAAVLGRQKSSSMGRPEDPVYQPFPYTSDEAVKIALDNSSEIKSINKMIEAAGYKVAMAEKEYYPDFTVSTGYSKRGGPFMDMYSASVTINLPIFRKSKLAPAVNEAKASVSQVERELDAVKLMISASVRDNMSMMESSRKLMDIYKQGLVPKNTQSVESAVSGYSTGGTEMITVITLSKNLLNYETRYWEQFAEREKAIARLMAIMEVAAPWTGGNQDEKTKQ